MPPVTASVVAARVDEVDTILTDLRAKRERARARRDFVAADKLTDELDKWLQVRHDVAEAAGA